MISQLPYEPRPDLFYDLGEVYEAFAMLSCGRGYNQAGPQPLTYSDIQAYIKDLGLEDDLDERALFIRYIRVLDSKYLELSHDKISKQREQLMSESKSGRVRKR